ncbi:LysR family transcriptional regulator [Frankia sp. Ag45/Mut15]|uniref:LysR family transcriptional regulator n=1 Tax=Frankia umida TaxID=573489 RepID=A0ABT0K2Y9_9ACTN|nr:LysR family transcriptional regulator [Frankia umida]MCK9877869.1 LysR family transcriptional regulator [Frankia umida]
MTTIDEGVGGPVKLGQIDLNLLVVLDALLREKNVTRAAESLHLSQPATSTALARLRRVLDDELLHKNGRYLELTPRAESLIEPVREVLATIEQTIARPPTFDPTTDSRRFSVIGSDYVAATLLRPLIARLIGLAAGLQVDATPVGLRYLEALHRDEVDLAILPDRIVDPALIPGCSRIPVIRERFVGVVWRDHPHAGDRLTADLLSRSPYLGYVTQGHRSLVEEELDAAGCARRVAATSSSMVTMAFLLAGTDLVAVLPERLATRVAEAAQIRLLEPEMPLRPLRESAYWHARRNRDPGHVWLRQQLFEVARMEFPPAAAATG